MLYHALSTAIWAIPLLSTFCDNTHNIYIYTCNIQKAIFWKILLNCKNIRRFAEKLTIQAKIADWAILACPNKSIYLSILRPCQRSNAKLKGKIATNASPPVASVLDRTAPSANKCFSFSFSLAEYLFVSNARRLNRGHMCLC